MSLKGKIVITCIVAFLLTASVNGVILKLLIQSTSEKIDSINTEFTYTTAENTLAILFRSVKSVAMDWAYWDDTYQFLSGDYPEYIEENVNQPALENIHVNLMAYYDTDNKLFHYTGYNHHEKSTLQLSESPSIWVAKYPALFTNHSGMGLVTGVIPLEEGPMYVVSAPIIKSDYSGPIIGTMVIGVFLDDQLVNEFFGKPGYNVQIIPVDQEKNSGLLADISAKQKAGDEVVVKVMDDHRIAGYSFLNDPNDNPSYIFQVSVTRMFLDIGDKVTTSTIIELFMFPFIVIIGIYLYLNKHLIQRLEILGKDLATINEKREPDSRLVIDLHKDEITRLSNSINENLDMMQAIQDEYKLLITNQGEGVLILDTTNNIQFVNPATESILQISAEALLGRNINEYLTNEYRGIFQKETSRIETGHSTSFELEIEVLHGEHVYILVTATPRINHSGEQIGSYAIFRDITELKKSNQVLQESEAKFRSLVEQSNVGIFLADADGKIIEWNTRMELMMGLSKDDAIQKENFELLEHLSLTESKGKAPARTFMNLFKGLVEGEYEESFNQPVQAEINPTFGTKKFIEISLFPIRTDSDTRIGGMVVDITEQKRMEDVENQQRIFIEALRDTSEALNSVLDFDKLMERILTNADRVIPSDAGVVLLFENGFLKVVQSRGYVERGLSDLTGKPAFPITDMKNMVTMAETGQPLAIADTASFAGWNPLPENKWVRSYIGMPLCVRDRIIGFVSLFHGTPGFYTQESADRLKAFASQTATAIENARLYAELQHKADTDELTGLRNRRSFFELGGREVERANRFGHSLSALMIDLDFFKQVNDTFGHPVGDRLVQGIADQFRKNLRNVDLVARYGGDEFVVLLPENDLAAAAEVGKRLQKAIETIYVETAQGKARVGVSIGVATINDNVKNLSTLIEFADRALYHAKQYGRSRVVSSPQ